MTADVVRVAFGGATGYVGRTLVPSILARSDFKLVGALGRKRAGVDIGTALGLEPAGVQITDDIQAVLAREPQVLIDYSAPEPAARWCRAAVEAGVAVVMATTALTPSAVVEIGRAAERNDVGVFLAGNLSTAAHLMMRCAELLGRYMGDVEIVEGHPSTKLDSPSGTSFETAELINRAGNPPRTADLTQFGLPESRGAQLGRVRVHSMRMPGMVDHQEVFFSSPGGLITIRTESFSPIVFAGPTLKAAKLILGEHGLVRELPGIYEPD